MDQGEAAELLRLRFSGTLGERLAQQLLRRTDSDPTLLAQILDQVDPAGDGLHRVPLRWPPSHLEPVLLLLRGLDPGSRRIIDAGAVIGREFDLAIVERICPDADVLSGLEAAQHLDLIRQLPGQVFSFTQALIREVCYDQLGARRRAELHERAAAALTSLGSSSGARAATVVELALHLGEAAALGGGPRLDAAAAAAATAASTAAAEGVHDVAAEYFAQAATLAGRAGWAPAQTGRLMVAAGAARLRAARSTDDIQVGRAALAAAVRLGKRAADPGLIAAAALSYGTTGVGDPDRLEALISALGVGERPATAEVAVAATTLEVSVRARLVARLSLELGRADLAVIASTLAHESGDPRALAEAGLAVAQLTGDRVSLRNAGREAAALGDEELLARARALAQPDPGLTAREREVLSLALKGVPGRDIAKALVLGERTVETHLANIYRKLGVRTRVELITRFGVTRE